MGPNGEGDALDEGREESDPADDHVGLDGRLGGVGEVLAAELDDLCDHLRAEASGMRGVREQRKTSRTASGTPGFLMTPDLVANEI